MTNQITTWAKTAARYNLLIDMHDDVRPFGYERTYPNWISLEGVRGNENFPTATHNVRYWLASGSSRWACSVPTGPCCPAPPHGPY